MSGIAKSFDFDAVPFIGQRVVHRGQLHELVRVEPHLKRDGEATSLLVWSSLCAQCGEPFEWRSPVRTEWPTKRCEAHRKPGRQA